MRAPSEWEKGHIPGAVHVFLPDLRKKAARLAKTKPVAVYCDSGYRASIGASILKQEGFRVRQQRAGKLAGMEEGQVPHRRRRENGA